MHVPVIAWWALGLVALRLAWRPVVALVLGRRIGASALARQPDAIHLRPASLDAARHGLAMEAAARTLMQQGFSDAGWFDIAELPGFTLRLLAHEPEGWLATVYGHPKAGQWVEIGARYPDGSRSSFTSSRASGLASLPGVHVTHMPGASVGAVLAIARKARVKVDTTPMPVSASNAPQVFEEGYAAIIALRKAQGLSRAEVAAVALRGPVAHEGAQEHDRAA